MGTGIVKLNQFLSHVGTQVVFSREAAKDYNSYPQGSRQVILEMLVKQAKKGARLAPHGSGIRLRAPLHTFGKIKRTSVNIRIIYRQTELEDGRVQMEIIAIGPREKAGL
jgi:mRNA interferase RelE/StbE